MVWCDAALRELFEGRDEWFGTWYAHRMQGARTRMRAMAYALSVCRRMCRGCPCAVYGAWLKGGWRAVTVAFGESAAASGQHRAIGERMERVRGGV